MAKSDKNIVWLAEKLAAEKKDLPRIFMACGYDDSLLEKNRHLRAALEKNGFDVTYMEAPGAHEWDFWNTHIKKVLEWLPLEGTAGVNSGNVGI